MKTTPAAGLRSLSNNSNRCFLLYTYYILSGYEILMFLISFVKQISHKYQIFFIERFL